MTRGNAMTLPTFAEYDALARSHGAEEVLERHWNPNQRVELHAHPFEAQALVTAGEMWLVRSDRTDHLLPGDSFHLPANTLHSERYGPEGATYWVARRSAA
jgi:quercetin dioxygenase-like cupin family protein